MLGTPLVKTIGVYCHAGEKRSVAFAELLSSCLISKGLVEGAPPCHLSKWFWQFKTCGGEGCTACSGSSTAKEDVLRRAKQAWAVCET